MTTHSPFPAVPRPHPVLTVLLLMLGTFLAYWSWEDVGLSNASDAATLRDDPLISEGLHPGTIARAFSASWGGIWHPLTTLSYVLDGEWFHWRATPAYWENLVWHTLNAMLVFLVWHALTAATWRPAIVAALFALHPLQAESVASISGRSDLLGAFFGLLGIWSYVGYARHPSLVRYGLMAMLMVLALLSQPAALPFPFILLLLDFWPLRRWPVRDWRSLFIEKLPLFGLVGVHLLLTFMVQRGAVAAQNVESLPAEAGPGHAVVAPVRLASQTFWPQSLAPYSPVEYSSAGMVTSAAVALSLVTLVIWWHRRTRPWLLFGWWWFMGTLLPVTAMFDERASLLGARGRYLPILGLFTLAVWQGARLAHLWPRSRNTLIAATVALLIVFGFLTARQLRVRGNRVALHGHDVGANGTHALPAPQRHEFGQSHAESQRSRN